MYKRYLPILKSYPTETKGVCIYTIIAVAWSRGTECTDCRRHSCPRIIHVVDAIEGLLSAYHPNGML